MKKGENLAVTEELKKPIRENDSNILKIVIVGENFQVGGSVHRLRC